MCTWQGVTGKPLAPAVLLGKCKNLSRHSQDSLCGVKITLQMQLVAITSYPLLNVTVVDQLLSQSNLTNYI